MNSKVLRYVFLCEKKKKQQDVKYVEERMFDFIHGKIRFVKKVKYLVLKMIIVFMYLFITIDTFILIPTIFDWDNF